MNDYSRLNPKTFKPTYNDVLHMRKKTKNFTKYRAIGDIKVTITDCGGEKLERIKWPNMYSPNETDIFCFVVPVSEFDQTLNEEMETNRALDTLKLFVETVSTLKGRQFYLIFTKLDVLAEKIKEEGKIDAFKKLFRDYEYHDTADDIVYYLKDLYTHKYEEITKSKLQCYTCNAVDGKTTKSLMSGIFKI